MTTDQGFHTTDEIEDMYRTERQYAITIDWTDWPSAKKLFELRATYYRKGPQVKQEQDIIWGVIKRMQDAEENLSEGSGWETVANETSGPVAGWFVTSLLDDFGYFNAKGIDLDDCPGGCEDE